MYWRCHVLRTSVKLLVDGILTAVIVQNASVISNSSSYRILRASFHVPDTTGKGGLESMLWDIAPVDGQNVATNFTIDVDVDVVVIAVQGGVVVAWHFPRVFDLLRSYRPQKRCI